MGYDNEKDPYSGNNREKQSKGRNCKNNLHITFHF